MPEPIADLGTVLPSVAAALGVGLPDAPGPVVPLPEARRAVVVLVDGLGEVQLAARGGHAPLLRRLRSAAATRPGADVVAEVLTSGFPATTATSLAMLGTGLPPGRHGLVGLELRDPDRDVLFSQLAWDPQVPAQRWQPHPTVFQRLVEAGALAVHVGPAHFDGSGLTVATMRGGRFAAATTLPQRVDAAVSAVRSAGPGQPALVFLYWGELDKAGHVHGPGSWQWGEELSAVDAAVRELARRLPADTLIVVCADHGMVDAPPTDRVDLAHDAELREGVHLVGGEPRAVHLYCEPGAADDVAATWRARLGDRMDVLTREEIVAAGWFGDVEPRVLPRIGDVVASSRDLLTVVDSRTARPEVLRLQGLHGARLDAERLVPLLAVTAGAAARLA
ncbi:MAG: alkaline phosphatase family protein [Kineosporiaceae bacterium]